MSTWAVLAHTPLASPRNTDDSIKTHTVKSLPVRLLLLIEDGVLVLRHHLLLPGHLSVPPLNGLRALSVPLQGGAEGINNAVDGA